MESSDESQDMSNGQLSSTATVNNVSPNPPLVPKEAASSIGFVRPPASRELLSAELSGFVSPSNCSGSRKVELKEEEFVIITEKTSQPYFQGEVEKIPKEEAICRFCFKIFQEDNVLKTKCKCNFTLTHESCATEWSEKKGDNECDVCKQYIQNIHVTLSTNHKSSNTNKMAMGNSTRRRFPRCFGS